MRTQIQGKIIADAPNYEHVNPTPVIIRGDVGSGEQTNVEVSFINTGNMPQTVEIISLSNFIGCELIEANFKEIYGSVYTIPAGQSGSYNIIFKAMEIPIASEAKDFTFDVDYQWL